MVFIRRTGTVENSGRSVYTEDRNCGKQRSVGLYGGQELWKTKMSEIFSEKFRKISKNFEKIEKLLCD